MRAANLLFLILALLVALASNAPTATASFLTARPSLHRRLLDKRTSPHTRHLLQSCSSCPAASTASATCSAASASQLNTIRAELISKCSSSAFKPSRCCELYSSSNWNTISACACSDTIAGLSAFVDGSTVMEACGCGPSGSSSGTSFTTTGPNLIGRVSSSNDSRSTSSSIDMAAVYSAVTFSNNDNGNSDGGGGGGGGSSPPSGGGSSPSPTGGGTGSTTTP